MSPNIKAVILSLAAYGIFATHDVVVKYLGATYSPFQILFFSMVFGFPLISLMLVGDSAHENLRPRHPWWAGLRSVSMMVGTACGFYAFSTLPLAQTYAMLFSMPLLITILSVPMLGERVGIYRGGAVIVGLVGVIIVLRPGTAEFTLGHMAALFAAFCAALAAIIVRKVGREERNVVMMLFPMLGTFLVMGFLMPLDYVAMPLKDLGASALMAALSFCAMLCMVTAYKLGESAIVAPMQYSQILWATGYGMLFFDEQPDHQTLAGAGVVILSGLLIVLREAFGSTSENTPVLHSRSRLTAGVSPILRAARKRWRVGKNSE